MDKIVNQKNGEVTKAKRPVSTRAKCLNFTNKAISIVLTLSLALSFLVISPSSLYANESDTFMSDTSEQPASDDVSNTQEPESTIEESSSDNMTDEMKKFTSSSFAATTLRSSLASTASIPVCKVVDITGVNIFNTIEEAVTYISNVSESDFENQFMKSGGVAKIEILVEEVEVSSTINISTGAKRPIIITTASADDTDGYEYSGDTTGDDVRAVVKLTTPDISAFYLDSASNVTLQNCIFDGNKSTVQAKNGFVQVADASTFTMQRGATIRNVLNGDYTEGAAVHLKNGTSDDAKTCFYMQEGSLIDACEASCGGGVFTSYEYTHIEIKGAISNCKATNQGGAMSVGNGCEVVITDSAVLTKNEASEGAAIYCGTGSDTGKASLLISGNAQIVNNTTTIEDSSSCAIDASNEFIVVTVSDSPHIYNNWDFNGESAGVQKNLADISNADVGSFIKVATSGLTTCAKIGVSSKNSNKAGNIFAQTEAEDASNISGLEAFVNDADSTLVGADGTSCQVKWRKALSKEVDTQIINFWNPVSRSKTLGKNINTQTFRTTSTADKDPLASCCIKGKSIAPISFLGDAVISPDGKVTGDNVKVVNDLTGPQVFSTFDDAVTYLGTVTDFKTAFASNGGTAKIEVLCSFMPILSTVTINLGSSKPIMLTTASASATDGYPYCENERDHDEEGRAIVLREWSGAYVHDISSITPGGEMFNITNSSKVTVKNIVFDGKKSAYDDFIYRQRRVFFLDQGANTLTLDSGALITNSDVGS